MRSLNRFYSVACAIVAFCGASARPFEFDENYTSAGIVPLFKTCAVRDCVVQERKECLLYVKMNVNGVELIADASVKRYVRDRDSAETAARAFFSRQIKFGTIASFADALRNSAIKIHMGDHITYLLEFDASDLLDIRLSRDQYQVCGSCGIGQFNGPIYPKAVNDFRPTCNDVIVIDLNELKAALNYGWQKRCEQNSARGVQVHDTCGVWWTIWDRFLIGLTDNYSKIKYLFFE